MFPVVLGSGNVGGRFLDVGTVLHCGGARGPSVWVGDVGYVPRHWEEYGQLLPKCGTQVEGKVAE